MGKNERLVREDIWSDVSGKYFTVSARVKTTVDGKMERDEFEGGKHELSRREDVSIRLEPSWEILFGECQGKDDSGWEETMQW